MTTPTRIMLVDDHSLCRSGLTELLEHRGGMTVVAATGSPDLVVTLLREHQPDLLVLDLRLAQTDGLTVLRRGDPERPLFMPCAPFGPPVARCRW